MSMNFVRFLENRFQEVTLQVKEIENQTDSAFDIKADHELRAIHSVLDRYRKLVHLFYMPKVIFHFFMMKLGFEPEPQPVMVNQMKEEVEKRKKLAAEKEAMKDIVHEMTKNTPAVAVVPSQCL